MKLKNARRAAAMLLALLMIVPLIGVPAFAENSTMEEFAYETFDSGEITNTYLNSFVSSGGVSIAPGTETGKAAYDKSLKVEFDASGDTAYGPVSPYALLTSNNTGAPSPTISYDDSKTNRVMVFEEDIYIPSDCGVRMYCQIYGLRIGETLDANRTMLWDLRTDGTGTNAGVYLRTLSANIVDGKANLQTDKSAISLNAWHTITTVLNLTTGKVVIYVDGVIPEVTVSGQKQQYAYSLKAASGVAAKNLSIYGVSACKLDPGNAVHQKGTFYLDNIELYTYDNGYVPNVPVSPSSALFSFDYEGATGTPASVGTNGPTANYATKGSNVVEIAMNDANLNKMFQVANKAASVGLTAPIVYSADYYINADATGAIASEFDASALYGFDFATGLFYVGDESIPFNKGAWNIVKTVIMPQITDVYAVDIYLNGIYAGTRVIADEITANSWSVAKVTKSGKGSFYFDNVKAVGYNGEVNEAVLDTNVIGFTCNGTTYINKKNTIKLYGLTSGDLTPIYADTYFETNRLIKTTDLSSIRLDIPSGLRFATEVYTDQIAALEALGATVVEMGTLITPADYAQRFGELTIGGNYEAGVNVVRVVTGRYYDQQIGEDPDATHFVGSIVHLIINETVNNVERDFHGRGYVIVMLANGTRCTIYSDHTAVDSVEKQAQDTLAAIKAGSVSIDEAYLSILEAYAKGENPA